MPRIRSQGATEGSRRDQAVREYEYTIVAPNRDRILERLSGEVIKRHAHTDALTMTELDDQVVCRLVTDDNDKTIAAIGDAGYRVSAQRQVFVHRFPDRPGILAEISRRASGAGLSLESAYPGINGQLVLAADDLAALENAVVDHAIGGAI
jgi:hypothetical protein